MTLKWHKDDLGQLTGIRWEEWLSRNDKFIDPYLVWVDLAGIASYGPSGTGQDKVEKEWSFIIELTTGGLTARCDPKMAGQDTGSVPLVFGSIDVPNVYKSAPLRIVKIDSPYITARISPGQVIELLRSDHVVRAELGLPRMAIDRVERTDPLTSDMGEGTAVVVGIIDSGFGFAHQQLLDAQGSPRIRYLWDQDKQRESDIGGSRWQEVEHLNYGAELGPARLEALLKPPLEHPKRPYGEARYGHYRHESGLISSAPLDEAGKPTLPAGSLASQTHGHAVLVLAAGFPPVHRGQSRLLHNAVPKEPRDFGVAVESVKTELQKWARNREVALTDSERIVRIHEDPIAMLDSADQWPLVCVQLPTRTVADTTGGSLAVHVLDGLRYIIDRARRIPSKRVEKPSEGTAIYGENRIIVNISYGAHAGAHDGTSIIEAAIASLIACEKNLWVVLAAGNAHGTASHSRFELVPGEDQVLSWEVPVDNPLESYLEIWIPGHDMEGVRLPDVVVKEIQVSVRPPNGPRLPLVHCGACHVLRRHDSEGDMMGTAVASIVFARRVVQSIVGTMVLLTVGATRALGKGSPLGARVPGPSGEWLIGVHWNAPAAPGPRIGIHVWTERNDLVFGAARGQQSRVFADQPIARRNEGDPEHREEAKDAVKSARFLATSRHLRPEMSLSSLVSLLPTREDFALLDARGHGSCAVVGGYRMSDLEVSAQSGSGPTRLLFARQEWSAQFRDVSATEAQGSVRIRPDVSAPSDVSPSVAGLRTAGFYSEVQSRISATSAAAALVTRAIANVQFVAAGVNVDSAKQVAGLLFEEDDRKDLAGEIRATLTPRSDDTFRRGRFRLR